MKVSSRGNFCPLIAFVTALALQFSEVTAFLIPSPSTSQRLLTLKNKLSLYEARSRGPGGGSRSSGGEPTSKKTYRKGNRKRTTLGDLQKQLLKNPEKAGISNQPSKRKKSRRTRQRVENPKQRYVYASQRKTVQREGNDGEDEPNIISNFQNAPVLEARKMGLTKAANQHADSLVDFVEPKIMGKIRVEDDNNGPSGAYAFLINKPAGWSILGEKQKRKKKQPVEANSKNDLSTNQSSKKRIKIKGEKDEYIEYDEADVLALLTPEERALLEADADSSLTTSISFGETDKSYLPGWNDVASMTAEEREDAGIGDEDYDPSDIPDFDEADIVALMSPEEREEYEADKLSQKHQLNTGKKEKKKKEFNMQQKYESMTEDDVDESAAENLRRIKARLSTRKNGMENDSFSNYQRPSVVSWLKAMKTTEGNPIRGGNYWTAVAGATDVDDSGLVLLCPKKNTKNLIVEYSEYIAVVGNGKFLSTIKKQSQSVPDDVVQVEMISRVRKGREGDASQTVRFVVTEHFSSCSSIIDHAQLQFEDGIRGDPASNPYDRRAPRRLIHCNSMSVSSLTFDETTQAETETFPDDIAILSDRLNSHKFKLGSFLGRQSLRQNPLTNAYREINGAADGFPGWTVDRYSDWLFVQHDEKEPRGPLPSIHDGNTAGVYLLPANPDRSAMGSNERIRPILLEGKAAPDIVPILENGVTYHVSLDKDLSTGIFLDQRPHRAWLTRNCNENTHVLNCFAHCGAFSVAAATAGASTVSLDLNKKWLDRVEPQLQANGIIFDERHDCIFGDCFEWLEKLSKRGEKFDIVILDPPSSSVGKKKKRWSVNRDMAELVELAAPLVRKGGLLWTTTNSASLTPLKYANSCRKGFSKIGVDAKLEKIQPMSVDFPSIGCPPVKNLVWRIN